MIAEILVVSGIEGPSVYVCDRRMAGPKPWGGGTTVYSFKVDLEDLKDAIFEFEEEKGKTE